MTEPRDSTGQADDRLATDGPAAAAGRCSWLTLPDPTPAGRHLVGENPDCRQPICLAVRTARTSLLARIAELERQLETKTAVAASNRRHAQYLAEYQDQLRAAGQALAHAAHEVLTYTGGHILLRQRVEEWDALAGQARAVTSHDPSCDLSRAGDERKTEPTATTSDGRDGA
jgi:hypothetical protein